MGDNESEEYQFASHQMAFKYSAPGAGPMSEADWLACTDPGILQFYLPPAASDRKLRLVACACCRRAWHLLGNLGRFAVEVAERFADGHATSEELASAEAGARKVMEDSHPGTEESAVTDERAWYAAMCPVGAAMNRSSGGVVTNLTVLRDNEPQSLVEPVDRAKQAYEAMDLAGALQSASWALAWDATNANIEDPAWEAAQLAEQARQMDLLRHIAGNPFKPYPAPLSWPAAVIQLAQAVYQGADAGFALHDALLEAGHPELAEHFRHEQTHPKGCWVVDLVLGKA